MDGSLNIAVFCVQDDWSLDVSEEAMKQRQKNLTAGVKNLTISNDIEKTQSERLEVFFEYCKVSESPHVHAAEGRTRWWWYLISEKIFCLKLSRDVEMSYNLVINSVCMKAVSEQ